VKRFPQIPQCPGKLGFLNRLGGFAQLFQSFRARIH
jgi:hypothetical protein